MGDVSEYDIAEPTTVLQKSEAWKNMSPEDRRKTAVEFYYSILGMCQKKGIEQCSNSDAKFIAKTAGLGDPECFFYCGYEKMIKNAAKLPSEHTLELAMKVGIDWDEEVGSPADLEELDNLGRQGSGLGRLNLMQMNL